jgi:hypothetical protein
MTALEVFLAQFDALALAPTHAQISEKRRPGALHALRAWAQTRRLPVWERDLRPDSNSKAYEVEIAQWCHSITVLVPANEEKP